MRWIDQAIAGIAPRYAIRRVNARLAVKAYYEAAKSTRLRKKRTDKRSPDATVQPAAEALRVQARHLEQNYDVARGALDILVANTVGTGIRPEPQIRTVGGDLATDLNMALLALWRDWIKTPEVTRDFDYYGAQRIVARSMFRDGEAFSQVLTGNIRSLDHGTRVPLSLELMEADMVPLAYDDQSKTIVQGVQKNTWGQPRNYFVYKDHPGGNQVSLRQDLKRIPAERMIHVKLVDRIRQTRGISVFASVIGRFDDIKEIDETERVAARVAAAMTGYIKKGMPDMYIQPGTGNDPNATQDEYRELEFHPGMIFDDLQQGEDIGTIQANRPNNALIPFRDSQLRSGAAGIGVGASSLSKNYNGTYSAQRQELVEQYGHYAILSGYFAQRFAHPVWESFVSMALASGQLEVSADIDPDTLYDADHSRPVMPWVDPVKEMNAIEKELKLGIASRSGVIRRRGGNPDEIRKQVEEERRTGWAQDDNAPGDPQPPNDPPPNPDEED